MLLNVYMDVESFLWQLYQFPLSFSFMTLQGETGQKMSFEGCWEGAAKQNASYSCCTVQLLSFFLAGRT